MNLTWNCAWNAVGPEKTCHWRFKSGMATFSTSSIINHRHLKWPKLPMNMQESCLEPTLIPKWHYERRDTKEHTKKSFLFSLTQTSLQVTSPAAIPHATSETRKQRNVASEICTSAHIIDRCWRIRFLTPWRRKTSTSLRVKKSPNQAVLLDTLPLSVFQREPITMQRNFKPFRENSRWSKKRSWMSGTSWSSPARCSTPMTTTWHLASPLLFKSSDFFWRMQTVYRRC